jgi:hypothetical protein
MEVSKLEATVSNDAFYGLTLTSNLRIIKKKNYYHIVVIRREKAEQTIGKRRFSSRHPDQNSAEKAAFEFQYSNEAGTGRGKVDDWLLAFNHKLLNGDFTVPPTEVQSVAISHELCITN